MESHALLIAIVGLFCNTMVFTKKSKLAIELLALFTT